MISVAVFTVCFIAIAVDIEVRSIDSVSRFRESYAVERLSADMERHVLTVSSDVMVGLYAEPVVDVLSAQLAGDELEAETAQIVQGFSAQLLAKPQYLQMRLLDVGGQEVVRVERGGNPDSIRVVYQGLQDKGERDYFLKTRELPAGRFFVSPIELNQEFGRVQEPHVPVLRVATPVLDSSNVFMGVVIINVDMRGMLDRLRHAGKHAGDRVYLVDEDGDYLVHPDRSQEFASERGQTARLQDEFPSLADLLGASGSQVRPLREADGTPYLVASSSAQLAGGPQVMVLKIAPLAVDPTIQALRRSLLLVVVVAISVAIVVAFLLARSLTRPLTEMAAVVERIPDDDQIRLPLAEPGEVGHLARAMQKMRDTIRERTAALARQTETFQVIVEGVPSAMVMVSPGGQVVLVNRAAEALFGYPRAEILGERISILVPDAEHMSLAAAVAGLLAAPEERTTDRVQELHGRHRSGRAMPVEIGLTPLEGPDGPVVLASIIDITERQRVQRWFERIVAASPHALLVLREEGTIMLANRAAEGLFQYPHAALIGQPITMLVPGLPSVRGEGSADTEAAKPVEERRDLYGRCRDGTEIQLEVALDGVEGPDGPAVLVSIVNITERQQRDEELRRSNAELEQFAYVASHDLQEPLRMVANYTELLARRYEGQLDERADKYIRYASGGARRMQQLVSDLLSFSRIGSQGRPLAPVDAGVVFAQACRSLQVLIRDTGATIAAGPLPQVLADEAQLHQVFQNLLSNAIKFRSAAPPQVRVTASRTGRLWTFSVADNGIGIEMKFAERIFQMFQRLHEIGRYEGSGIGLAISRRIIDRHGGHIWVESEPDTGSSFSFTLHAVSEDLP